MKLASTILILVAFSILNSCKAKQAIVTKQPPQLVQINKYPLAAIKIQPIRLKGSTSFLWKNEAEMTDTQVRDVQLISKKMDKLENEQRELKRTLNQFTKAYEIEVAKLDDQQKREWNTLPEKIDTQKQTVEINKHSYAEKFPKLSSDLNIENQKLIDVNKNLDEATKELKNEESKSNPNQETIDQISQLIIELQNTKKTIETKIATIENKIKKLQDKITTAQNELDQLESIKAGVYKDVNASHEVMKQEEARIAPEEQAFNERGNELVKLLFENVDKLDSSPTSLNLKVTDDDSLLIELTWKIINECNDCDENYSNAKNNLHHVSYQEDGGLLKFDLVDHENTYVFRLVRSKENDPSGRIFYSGDLNIQYKDGHQRFGVLNFVSSNF